jgi:hypothetical protein
MADYHLEKLNDDNAEKWEDFNNHSAEGSLFHSLRWKELVKKTSGIAEQYFLLFKNGEVIGLFPFIGHDIGFFRGLVPQNDPQRLPAILRDYHDPLVMNSVIRDLQKVRIDGKRISFIRFSTVHEETLNTITTHPLLPVNNEGDMILNLSELSPEKIWNSFSAKKGERKFIRRFDKDGFVLTEANSPDDLELFYKFYEENITYVKGTVQPISRFSELKSSLSDKTRITLLSKGPIFAGGMLQLLDHPRKTVHTLYLSLNRNLPANYHPPYYLWWEAINWAWENHYEKISMGVQHLDENNPRTQVKYALGARFKPMYSTMIPLTTTFTLSYKGKRFIEQLHLSRK